MLRASRGHARNRDGYACAPSQAALWCAFYSTRMTGEEARPDDPQPNNPAYWDWYSTILCPWNLDNCGGEARAATARTCPLHGSHAPRRLRGVWALAALRP